MDNDDVRGGQANGLLRAAERSECQHGKEEKQNEKTAKDVMQAHLSRRRQGCGDRGNQKNQKVGGVLTHKIQVSERPGFFQRWGVELSK
jgi:hypothetical protein